MLSSICAAKPKVAQKWNKSGTFLFLNLIIIDRNLKEIQIKKII